MEHLSLTYTKRVFEFKRPSGTSRGILRYKKSWFLEARLNDSDERVGLGECSIIEGLSPDYIDDAQYERKLNELCKNPAIDLIDFPSIRFGLECAKLDLSNGGVGVYFNNDFTKGLLKIPINGLIWMGAIDYMREQIEEKLAHGYNTIKLKIGAGDIQSELDLIREVRQHYAADNITIRVDANGAFSASEAPEVLDQLAALDIHSIEQPIKAGQWEEMARLCRSTSTPIALDEELIGINDIEKKRRLLEIIKPQYIILKPSLHGGIEGCREWINIAEEHKVDWWMTSALESNIGLRAIAQFTAEYSNPLPQGLGTGGLFTNNFQSDLVIETGLLFRKLD